MLVNEGRIFYFSTGNEDTYKWQVSYSGKAFQEHTSKKRAIEDAKLYIAKRILTTKQRLFTYTIFIEQIEKGEVVKKFEMSETELFAQEHLAANLRNYTIKTVYDVAWYDNDDVDNSGKIGSEEIESFPMAQKFTKQVEKEGFKNWEIRMLKVTSYEKNERDTFGNLVWQSHTDYEDVMSLEASESFVELASL